jgi:hypothetical protein
LSILCLWFSKTFYQETDSVLEISSILALVALSVFSLPNAQPASMPDIFSSLPPNHGNPPDFFVLIY